MCRQIEVKQVCTFYDDCVHVFRPLLEVSIIITLFMEMAMLIQKNRKGQNLTSEYFRSHASSSSCAYIKNAKTYVFFPFFSLSLVLSCPSIDPCSENICTKCSCKTGRRRRGRAALHALACNAKNL